MQQDEIHTLATSILLLLDEKMVESYFLSKGSTSSIWMVKSNLNTYALRIIDTDERVISGTIDCFIRSEISARGGKTASPILHSEMSDSISSKKRWSLDEYVAGVHPEPGILPLDICREFGTTLAALHDIPVSQCGRPVQINNSVILGEKLNSLDGVMQRFENPMPETWKPGFDHPVIVLKPNMASNIFAILKDVADIVKERNHVLCHSDLHARQILCADDQLNALIDFGDATILDRNWDLGSALYFHGLDNFRDIHNSYIEHSDISNHGLDIVRFFSVAVAMHHASRSRLPGKGHRLDRAVSHIMGILGG